MVTLRERSMAAVRGWDTPMRSVSWRWARFFAERGEAGRKALLVLHLVHVLLGARRFEDLLFPLVEAHRRFPLLRLVVFVVWLAFFAHAFASGG